MARIRVPCGPCDGDLACGMTQRELCAKLKRRNNYIQNIESGTQSVGAAELLGKAIQAADK
jgi:transcriptional regulator with XRE-family HTH domain